MRGIALLYGLLAGSSDRLWLPAAPLDRRHSPRPRRRPSDRLMHHRGDPGAIQLEDRALAEPLVLELRDARRQPEHQTSRRRGCIDPLAELTNSTASVWNSWSVLTRWVKS